MMGLSINASCLNRSTKYDRIILEDRKSSDGNMGLAGTTGGDLIQKWKGSPFPFLRGKK